MPQPALQWTTSAASMPAPLPTLLLVDDDRIMRVMLTQALRQHHYQVHSASDGEEALGILAQHPGEIDAIVLDREMPGMNGMELVARLKADPQFNTIPVIMLTGSGDTHEIQEGIDAGVYYYLVKPADNILLRSIIESALRERRQKVALLSELGRHDCALAAMQSCQLSVRTIREAEDTACLLASCFPEPERVVNGLLELLINAVEHGSLGITYDEKQELLNENTWRSELDRRAALPENQEKRIDVTYQRKPEGYLVQITDPGPGFDWKRYWHINPARATASHGRGIARARLMAFDRLAYNDKGNSVTVMVNAQGTAAKAGAYAW